MKEERKTSKEILSELFDKFNATPPSSPSVHSVDNDGENFTKKDDKKKKKKRDKDKCKKKRKKEKKSKRKHNDKKSNKKKKKRHKSKSESESSSIDGASESDNKKKKEYESVGSKIPYKKIVFGEVQHIKKEKHSKKEVTENSTAKSTEKNIVDVKLGAEISISKDAENPSTKVTATETSHRKSIYKRDSNLIESEGTSSVVLPDVIPTACIKEQKKNANSPQNCKEKGAFPEGTLPQVADIFVEELLESTLAAKATSTDKSKVNIKITDLKKSNILELAEQKLKEKAEKYEEGEITSDSSEDTEALPSLRPIESDPEENVPTTNQEEKVKKCSRRKSHKSSRKRGSRSKSGSKGRKTSHGTETHHPKRTKSRSRDRSRSRGRKRRRSASLDKWKDDKYKEKKSHRDRSGHRKKDWKDGKSERDVKEFDKKCDKKDGEKKEDKEKTKHSKERISKSREKRRNKSKSPLQLPSMILQDNPNKKKRRSRSRSRGLDIDKKKLLEIARKNALSMLKQQGGTVPAIGDPAKVATTITAGGKTVDELTDFCKQLSQKEGRDDNVELSPISDSSEEEGEKAFHHPFLIKDRPSNIVMNIRNCAALPVRTHQEKTAEAAQQLRLQFPVSSGQHHRKTENEWVPVEPKKDEPPAPVKPVNKVIGNKIVVPVDPGPIAIEPPPLPLTELVSVFPSVEEPVNINIGDVVGQKLAAVKRLQENPADFAAHKLLRDAEDKLARWNESHQLQQPGLFTGSTGARLLTPAELASGQQAWAKKDQLMCATPVTEGIGKSLLQKMGWKPGEGLGKNHEGTLEPLTLPLKMDKRGLVCAEEVKKPLRFTSGHNPRTLRKPTVKSLEGKHPVSLLLEYCTKRHFNPPIFNVCFESGPSHKRMFLFKVEVNGVEYQPPAPSNNKKLAKSEAALVCLRALGLMPSTTAPSTPT